MAWQAENIAFVLFTGRPELDRPDKIFEEIFAQDFDEFSAEPGPITGKRASAFDGSLRKSVLARPGRIDIVFDSPRNHPPMLDEPASALRRFLPMAQNFVEKQNTNRVSCVANLMKNTGDEAGALALFYQETGLSEIPDTRELGLRYNKPGKIGNYRSNFIYDFSVVQIQFMEFQVMSGQAMPSSSETKSLFYLKKVLDFNAVPIPSIPCDDAVTLLAGYADKIIREIDAD